MTGMTDNNVPEQFQGIPGEFPTQLHTYIAVTEHCSDTGLYVGYIPEFPGAHSQGETLEELKANLHEVTAMLLDDDSVKVIFNS